MVPRKTIGASVVSVSVILYSFAVVSTIFPVSGVGLEGFDLIFLSDRFKNYRAFPVLGNP